MLPLGQSSKLVSLVFFFCYKLLDSPSKSLLLCDALLFLLGVTSQCSNEIRLIGLAQLDKEQRDLVDAADEDPKRLEDSKNYTIRFEKQRAIEQVRQQVSRLASERALESPNSRSDNELHLRLIDYKIGLLKSMEDVADQN